MAHQVDLPEHDRKSVDSASAAIFFGCFACPGHNDLIVQTNQPLLQTQCPLWGRAAFWLGFLKFGVLLLYGRSQANQHTHSSFTTSYFFRNDHHQGTWNRHAISRTKSHWGWAHGHDPRGMYRLQPTPLLPALLTAWLTVIFVFIPLDRCRWQWNYRLPWVPHDDGP